MVDIRERIADSEWACITILARREVAMFRLLRSITLKQCFTEQIPALAGAAVIAELFYKFHSFLLECGAFLATWFVLDLLLQGVAWLLAGKKLAVRAGQGPAVPLLLWFALAITGCREATSSQPAPAGAPPAAPAARAGRPDWDDQPERRPNVACVALSADGKLGLSVMGDIMTLWSFPGGKALRRFEPVPKNPLPDVWGASRRNVYELAVNWEHRVAATGDSNGLLRIWDLTTGALRREIQAIEREPGDSPRPPSITALALSAEGARIYSSGTELHPPSAVNVWDLKTGKLLQVLAPVKTESQHVGYDRISLLKNGRQALLKRQGYFALWDLPQDKCVWERDGPNPGLIASNETGSRLLTCSGPGRVVRGAKGEELRTLQHLDPKAKPPPGYYSLVTVFVPAQGSRVLSAGYSGELVVWDVDQDKTVAEFKGGSSEPLKSLALSADGRFAFTGSENAVLQLWRLNDGKVFQIHQ
jgi:WD40 repeat protein